LPTCDDNDNILTRGNRYFIQIYVRTKQWTSFKHRRRHILRVPRSVTAVVSDSARSVGRDAPVRTPDNFVDESTGPTGVCVG